MATINAKLLKRTDSQGLSRVQIAIQHKGEVAYISTDIKVNPSDFADGRLVKGKNKNPINASILELVNYYRDRLEAETNLPAINVIQLKEHLISTTNKRYTMVSEGWNVFYAQCKSDSTRKLVRQSQDLFLRFCKGKDITIQSIDYNTVHSYRNWLLTAQIDRTGKHYSTATQLVYMRYLSIIVNHAVKKGLVHFDVNPFEGINLSNRNAVRDNCISAETFNIIRSYTTTAPSYIIAKDIFLLSFYLGGINLVDMMNIDFSKDKFTFVRQKIKSRTNTKVTLPILPEARQIINKYIGENGKLSLDHYKGNGNYKALHALINDRLLAKIKVEHNIDEYMTFYSARKCFAQTGMNIGISDNIIDYILGHSPSNRGIIAHYSSVMPALAEEAMKLIFEFIDKPEDIKTIFRKNILNQLRS